jgi:hypothetical protein
MRNLFVTLLVTGLALGVLPTDPPEVLAQAAKGDKKGKAAPRAKALPKTKAPMAAKPSVHTKANTKVKPAGIKHPESQKTSDHHLVQAYRVLRSVNKTLLMADHDYGGHRANAARDTGKAEKQLAEALGFRGEKSPQGKTAASHWHPEPQKLSNAQLAAALPVLHRTIAALEGADKDYGGHKAKAIADLKSTIRQIDEAMQSVKK